MPDCGRLGEIDMKSWRATNGSEVFFFRVGLLLRAFCMLLVLSLRTFAVEHKPPILVKLGISADDGPEMGLILPSGSLRIAEYDSVLRDGRMLCRLKLAEDQLAFVCLFAEQEDAKASSSGMSELLVSKSISLVLEPERAAGKPVAREWHSGRDLELLITTQAGAVAAGIEVSKSTNLESAEWFELSEIVYPVSLPRSRREADLENRLQQKGGDVSVDEVSSILKAGTVLIAMRRLDIFEAARRVPFSRPSVGRAEFVKGKPEAVEPSGAVRALVVGSPVYQTDRLVCGSAAKLSVEFHDGTVLWLGESSDLTVDAYAFVGDKPSRASAALRFAKGVCRIVTGAITKLNPERFKVRMRMASIGIRGCETGFRSTDVRNDVYILEIGKLETVVVAATVDGSDFASVYVHDLSRTREEDRKIRIIEMSRSGSGVSVVAEKGPTLVELERSDVRFFRDATSHLPSARFDIDQEPAKADVMIRPAEKQAPENEVQ